MTSRSRVSAKRDRPHTGRLAGPAAGSRVGRARNIAALLPCLLLGSPATPAPGTSVVRLFGTEDATLPIHDPAHPRETWPAQAFVADTVLGWRTVRPGIDVADIGVGAPGDLLSTVALARIDPAHVRFTLRSRTRAAGTLGGWSIGDLSPDGVIALNAGQFEGGIPWGWVVRDGWEASPPGHGPLSTAVVFDTAGTVRLVAARDIPFRRFGKDVVAAFQSYPTILEGGRVPPPVLREGLGVDHRHRDVRLALGTLRDGRVLLALTRLGETGGYSLPWGPTVPEMAALMGALGATDAVLLDGGLSAQLAVRDAAGEVKRWPAPRRVPLALEAVPR